MSIESFVAAQRGNKRMLPEYTVHFQNFLKDIQSINFDDLDVKAVQHKTPEQITDLKAKLDPDTCYRISNFFNYLPDFKPVTNLNNDAADDLQAISNHENVSGLSCGSGRIAFKFKCEMFDPNTNTTFDFGTFNIRLSHSQVLVLAYENNTLKDRFYHPYVNYEGGLCLGDFLEGYKNFWQQMNYYECFMIVERVLCRYGISHTANGTASDPYVALNKWTGYQCFDCGEVVPVEKVVLCGKTDEKICSTCADAQRDEDTNIAYLSHLIKTCDDCGKKKLGVIKAGDKQMCTSCLSIAGPKSSTPKKIASKSTTGSATKKKDKKKVALNPLDVHPPEDDEKYGL